MSEREFNKLIIDHEWKENCRMFGYVELKLYKERMIKFFGSREECIRYLEYWK